MANEPAPEPSDSPRRVDPQAVLQGAAGTDLARIAPGRTWAWEWPGPQPTAPVPHARHVGLPDARQALRPAPFIVDSGASVDVAPGGYIDDPLVPGADVSGAFLAAPVTAQLALARRLHAYD